MGGTYLGDFPAKNIAMPLGDALWEEEWYCLICNMDSNPQRASSNAIFTLPNHASAWTPCVIPLSSSAILFSASHHRVQPAVAPNAPLYLLLTATPCFPL